MPTPPPGGHSCYDRGIFKILITFFVKNLQKWKIRNVEPSHASNKSGLKKDNCHLQGCFAPNHPCPPTPYFLLFSFSFDCTERLLLCLQLLFIRRKSFARLKACCFPTDHWRPKSVVHQFESFPPGEPGKGPYFRSVDP